MVNRFKDGWIILVAVDQQRDPVAFRGEHFMVDLPRWGRGIVGNRCRQLREAPVAVGLLAWAFSRRYGQGKQRETDREGARRPAPLARR